MTSKVSNFVYPSLYLVLIIISTQSINFLLLNFLFFYPIGFKLALIQLGVTASKPDNLQRASKLIKEAAEKGAKVISLPECFNSPYGLSNLRIIIIQINFNLLDVKLHYYCVFLS